MRIAVLMRVVDPWSRAMARRLAAQGHELTVLDLDLPDDAEIARSPHGEGIREMAAAVHAVRRLRSAFPRPLRYFTLGQALRAALAGARAELLLTLYAGGYAALAYVSGFRPYVVYVVGSDVLLARGLKRPIFRVALEASTLVLTNGRYLGERTRTLAPRADVRPLYIGVDVGTFEAGPRTPGPVRVVCTRKFRPVYNNDDIVRALALVPADVPAFTFTFVSSGPGLERTRRLADVLLRPPRRAAVEFLGGVTDEELARRVRDAHVYVSMSLSDGASISLLEALTGGLFPILSDIPPNREWIDEAAGNGLLVPVHDARTLAAALARAITDPAMRERAAAHNLRIVLERADARKTAVELSAALERCVVRAPAAARA